MEKIKKFFSFILESIFPIVIVLIAIIVSFMPQIGSFSFDINDIILSLFSILAIDSILDKYKTKKRIIEKIEQTGNKVNNVEDNINTISEKVNALDVNEILKKRSDFERLEHIFKQAKKELFISGVNLEGLVPSCDIIKELANNGVHIRLLMLDPNGKRLVASSDMSGVTNSERKKKIKANFDFLTKEFAQELQTKDIELKTIDNVLPLSFIGIDISYGDGHIIVQNYLFKTPSSKSLMLEFTQEQIYWYNLYKEQLELIWKNGK
ncbi:MAG: hypothetical protein HFJ99_00615 [Eubacterium sp.]|nr:hypothetical protein [Eubacterium sp.]